MQDLRGLCTIAKALYLFNPAFEIHGLIAFSHSLIVANHPEMITPIKIIFESAKFY
jgi:hypothetical protein